MESKPSIRERPSAIRGFQDVTPITATRPPIAPTSGDVVDISGFTFLVLVKICLTHACRELRFSTQPGTSSVRPVRKLALRLVESQMLNRIAQLALLLVIGACPSLASAQINGFTEPFRKVELASDEAGSIASLLVDEGSHVEAGQVLAELDDRVQRLQVESAEHLVNSTSALEAASRTLDKRSLIAGRIRELINTGHATESELIRAELEESIARAKYVAAEEETIGREIDLRRAQLMLERRAIRAPFSAVVSQVYRQEGEFLSPLHPEVVSLIQVDKLLAVFNVPSNEIADLRNLSQIPVLFNDGTEVTGKLHSIGVQTDAESGTVAVKVLLDNSAGNLRGGEQCYLDR